MRDLVAMPVIPSAEAVPAGGTGLEETIRAFGRGEMVVVTDDDGRENEGDLILAAAHCTPEKMAFIVRHTSGIVCAPMTAEAARRLNLQPMVAENDAPHATAFTVSVDFRHGTTTGISAQDRTLTVRNLANPNASAADFVRPGHVFPLVAREGGVLIRSGHTEAAVDLCRLAGLPPVGVICELVNDDGSVMRGPQLARFARAHGLRQVSVADIIAWRQRKETLVRRMGTHPLHTAGGAAVAHVFALPWETVQHLAVVFGGIGDGRDLPVRLHVEDVAQDVFGPVRPLEEIMRRMGQERRGVIVHLRAGSVGVADQRSHAAGRPGHESHDEALRRESEWREIGLGAQILRALGISSIELLTTRRLHYVGLEAFGIRIAATRLIGAGASGPDGADR